MFRFVGLFSFFITSKSFPKLVAWILIFPEQLWNCSNLGWGCLYYAAYKIFTCVFNLGRDTLGDKTSPCYKFLEQFTRRDNHTLKGQVLATRFWVVHMKELVVWNWWQGQANVPPCVTELNIFQAQLVKIIRTPSLSLIFETEIYMHALLAYNFRGLGSSSWCQLVNMAMIWCGERGAHKIYPRRRQKCPKICIVVP